MKNMILIQENEKAGSGKQHKGNKDKQDEKDIMEISF